MVNTDSEMQAKSINNGPRVSFNRDVHVKRYGSQLNHNDHNDSLTSRSQSPVNFRRELPNLSEEALEKEAALVLEQASYFGSLPHRSKISRKPIRRSISDASSKKSKRNSIFNIFNTTTNLPSPEKHAINKKVERSKSDVSSRSSKKREKVNLHASSFNNSLTNSDSSDNNTFLTSTPKVKAPLSPITELSPEIVNKTDYFDEKPTKLPNGKGFASSEDLGLASDDKLNTRYSKSVEVMHSSQQPIERPALTKGATVNKMIKRLSIERLSPPQQVIQAGGFSYTNPQLSPLSPYSPTKTQPPSLPITLSEEPSNIVYAQVVCNADGKSSSDKTLRKSRASASPPSSTNFVERSNVDLVADNFLTTASSPGIHSKGTSNQVKSSVKIVRDFDDVDNSLEEPIIKPNIRSFTAHAPQNNNYHIDNDRNEFSSPIMRDFDGGMDLTLSSRREILESRIKSRIGGLHTNNDNGKSSFVHRTSHSPPTIKRYHKYGSNENVNRFSPERNHSDLIESRSPSWEKQTKKYAENTLRLTSKSHNYNRNGEKGDSGIEVDTVTKNNRKNRYNSRFNLNGRRWNYEDDIIECELFLMKEKKHTEETYPFQLVRTYVYRERSIDDGSHYDPNLDKANIIKEWKHNKKMTRDFIKSRRKTPLEKVKDLFKSKLKSNGVDDKSVRSRYREYSPDLEPPPVTHHNIANLRRLSTPTASPVVTSRSKSLPPKGKKLNGNVASTTSTLRQDKENNAQKFNWFASLDRLSSKNKTKEPSTSSTIDRKSSISRAKSTSMKNVSSSQSGSRDRTLRFFGDTDREESISKASGRRLSTSSGDRLRSSSLQNLNTQRKVKQTKSVSRSRSELQNISESTSDTDAPHRPRAQSPASYLPPPRPPKSTKLVSTFSSTLPRPPRRKMFDDEETDVRFSREESLPYYPKKDNYETDSLSNLTSARKLRETMSVSRENLHRDRFDSDASQRSVVYLHATTVGEIQSTIDRRRPSGKISLKSSVANGEPAMTRTVNRSASLSAPWKPKFMSEGYEINYNNDDQTDKHHQNELRSKSSSREMLRERRRV